MKKIFIGHFGGKDKEDWFLAWANDKDDAANTVDKMFGDPIFIEELQDVPSGAVCLNLTDISNDDKPFYFLEALPDDLKFENDDYIQQIIKKEKGSSTKIDNDQLKRSRHKEENEKQNGDSEKSAEDQYQAIRDKIDSIEL
ncbi:MAG: hypothetical protein U9R21_01390 [Candidatus Thermoplasmatota archaeon]|nr:hypothetical protein [Candidatus Thermoplasmatota archaeon]